MSKLRFYVFSIQGAYGALAWLEGKLVLMHTLLPVSRRSTAVGSMRSHAATEDKNPPAWILEVVERVQNYFSGVADDFRDLKLDFSKHTDFQRRIYNALRKIPAGQTISYGELAAKVGSPAAARAVGQAMAKNPIPLIVPCHRVVASNGKMQGFSSERGTDLKQEMLVLESS